MTVINKGKINILLHKQMAKIKLFQALSQAIKRDAAVRGAFRVLKRGFE